MVPHSGRSFKLFVLSLVSVVAFAWAVAAFADAAADRGALWRVVNICIGGQRTIGIPFVCQSVDLKKGIAVLGVRRGEFLITPTVPAAGIESPQLRSAAAPPYWEYAWESRKLLDQALGSLLSRDEVGLAVNSLQSRSQDQLHIHLGCIQPGVRLALRAYGPQIGDAWSKLPFSVGGQFYRIMRIDGDALGSVNPFELLATGVPDARRDMASRTLVLVGAKLTDGHDGFYLLADQSVGDHAARGESLLDYECTVAAAG